MSTPPKPSEKAMEFERMLGHCTCEPQWPDGDRKCDCPGCVYLQYQASPELSKTIHAAIDALLAEARREALEEAAKLCDKKVLAYVAAYVNGGHRPQANIAASLAAAIRALAAKEQQP